MEYEYVKDFVAKDVKIILFDKYIYTGFVKSVNMTTLILDEKYLGTCFFNLNAIAAIMAHEKVR
jgi:hypothetical protein